jgi:hypothetical protein
MTLATWKLTENMLKKVHLKDGHSTGPDMVFFETGLSNSSAVP